MRAELLYAVVSAVSYARRFRTDVGGSLPCAYEHTDHPRVWRDRFPTVAVNSVLKLMKTGDIVLVKHKRVPSILSSFMMKSQFTHVGLVVLAEDIEARVIEVFRERSLGMFLSVPTCCRVNVL